MAFKPYLHKSCARKRFFLKRQLREANVEKTHFRERVMRDNLRFRRNVDERDRLLEASEAKIQKLESKMVGANEAQRQLAEKDTTIAHLETRVWTAEQNSGSLTGQLEESKTEIARLQSEMVSANDLQKFEDQLTANEVEIETMHNQMVGAIELKDRQLAEAMAKLKLKDEQLKTRNNEIAQLQCSLMMYEDELQESVNKSGDQLKSNNIEIGQSHNLMAAANGVQNQLDAKDAKIKSLEKKLSLSQRNNEQWQRDLQRSHGRWSKTMEERDKFVAEMRQKDKEIEELKAKLKQVDSKKQQEEADRQLAMMLAYDESGGMDFDMEDSTPTAPGNKNFDRGYDSNQFDDSAMEEANTTDTQLVQEEADRQFAMILAYDESGGTDFDMKDGTPNAFGDSNSDYGYDSLEALKTAYKSAMEKIKEMQTILDALSRHCVYGFFTKEKQLLYAGQTTNFAFRIYEHFAIATEKYAQSKAKAFHTTLKTELVNGVYAVKLFEGLNELQANDVENCLILKLKELGIGANIDGGRCTVRFLMLDDKERQSEVDRVYEEAMFKIQDVSEDKLVTLDTPMTLDDCKYDRCACGSKTSGTLTCRKCNFIKQKDVECKRDQCFTLGVGSNGYCFNCYTVHWKAINDGKILPTYQAKFSHNPEDKKNSLPRALVLSMQIYGGAYIVSKVKNLFPSLKMVAESNVNRWIRNNIKKVESADDLANYLKAEQESYAGLQPNTVDHLLVYEHSMKRSAEAVSKRLTDLFYCPVDEGKFSLAIVQEKFANIEAIKSVICRPIEQPTTEDETPTDASNDENETN